MEVEEVDSSAGSSAAAAGAAGADEAARGASARLGGEPWGVLYSEASPEAGAARVLACGWVGEEVAGTWPLAGTCRVAAGTVGDSRC